MDAEKLYKWIVDSFEKDKILDQKFFQKIPREDLEHVKFLLDYLVSKELVKSETVGEKTSYESENLDGIKKLLGFEKSEKESPSLKESLVVSIPLSLSDNLSLLQKKHTEVSILELKDALKLLISQAKHEILITSPFMELDGIMYILDEIAEAAKRGVSIRVISRDILERKNYDFSYANKLKGISKLYVLFEQNKSDPTALLSVRDYGKSISQYSGQNLHYEGIHQKMVIVDRKYAYVGSGEIRSPSFITNGEAGALFLDKKAEFWADFFEMFWKNAKEIPKDIIETKI